MKLIITIELGNEAAQTPEDVVWILRDLANRIEHNRDMERPPVDSNGNVVGSSKLKGK